jgi:hypothetical protein
MTDAGAQFAMMKQDHIWLPLLILTTGRSLTFSFIQLLKLEADFYFRAVYSNSLLSLLNGRLHLGYQADTPFAISLSTFRPSSHSRSRGQVRFSAFSVSPHLGVKPRIP